MRRRHTKPTAEHARKIGKIVEASHECCFSNRNPLLFHQFSGSRDSRPYNEIAKRNAVLFFEGSTELERAHVTQPGCGCLAELLGEVRGDIADSGSKSDPRVSTLFRG